jgi:hypothetical protein
MTHFLIGHHQLVTKAMLVALALLLCAMPTTQNAVVWALDKFVEITDRALHFPCTLLDHGKCFTLDRLDPACPQCL